MIGITFLNVSVHQHHLLYILKYSHEIIIFYHVSKNQT